MYPVYNFTVDRVQANAKRSSYLRNDIIELEAINAIRRVFMAKYGKKAQEKVEKTMHEMKKGTLKSGKSGKKVTSKKQAVAIGLSKARKEGAKVPKKKNKE